MAQSFTDTADHEWTIEINIAAVKRVKAALDIDLLEAVSGPLIDRFIDDAVLLCDVIFVLCQQHAEAAGISPEDFGKAMRGDAIDHATAAFLEALVDFFPSQRRTILKKALAKAEQLRTMARHRATEVLESDQLDRALTEKLDEVDVVGASPSASGDRKKSGD